MDARLDFWIAVGVMSDGIELRDGVEHLAPGRLGDPGRIIEEQDRRAPGPESHPLVARWQKSARPQPRKQRLVGVDRVRLREQDDKRRKILVLASESVTEPRPHARPSGLLKTCLDERDRRIVIDRLGVHRLDDGDVVDDPGGMRKQFADPCAGLAVLREFERRLCDEQLRLPHRLRDALPLANRIRNLRPLKLRQHRLVVECLELRRTAGLVEEDDALRRRRKMRHADESAGPRISLVERASEGTEIRSEQCGQRADADPLCGASEELTPRQVQIDFMFDVHGWVSRTHRGRYCLVIVSSKLKITLATVVYAASSATSSRGLRGDSPTATSFIAPRRSWRYAARRPSSSVRRTLISCVVGLRAVARRNAYEIRAVASLPPSTSARCARTRDASTKVGSFSNTSACRGVFVCARRAVHFSRSGASKVANEAGGAVRFHSVYMPRQYKSGPWLWS